MDWPFWSLFESKKKPIGWTKKRVPPPSPSSPRPHTPPISIAPDEPVLEVEETLQSLDEQLIFHYNRIRTRMHHDGLLYSKLADTLSSIGKESSSQTLKQDEIEAATVPAVSLSPAADNVSIAADTTTAVASSVLEKGKGKVVEEDLTSNKRTRRQMEEDRLGEEAAQLLHDDQKVELARIHEIKVKEVELAAARDAQIRMQMDANVAVEVTADVPLVNTSVETTESAYVSSFEPSSHHSIYIPSRRAKRMAKMKISSSSCCVCLDDLLGAKQQLKKGARMNLREAKNAENDVTILERPGPYEQRMKIVEMGGAQKIVDMLSDAKDDAPRKEALNAIILLARVDEAVGALHSTGVVSAVMATPESTEDAEIEKHKRKLLKRFRYMNYGLLKAFGYYFPAWLEVVVDWRFEGTPDPCVSPAADGRSEERRNRQGGGLSVAGEVQRW
ncbi:ARM repeat superfamily protein [Artemisia annua]|uniref:ARM repeat superfamily protein n=1 Tax=Artemisia annua TaxID=35608 RepID=A0A2U1LJF3_ARTAN|nr:ARM repeat superfamily protein [Artemisia annua]